MPQVRTSLVPVVVVVVDAAGVPRADVAEGRGVVLGIRSTSAKTISGGTNWERLGLAGAGTRTNPAVVGI
jgi:hypothetical protein